jgi:hypothetical protein
MPTVDLGESISVTGYTQKKNYLQNSNSSFLYRNNSQVFKVVDINGIFVCGLLMLATSMDANMKLSVHIMNNSEISFL